MARPLTRPFLVLCGAAALTALLAAPAGAQTPAQPSAVTCSGTTHTSVTATSVTVTGSATCTGIATLSLTTTLDTSGIVSTVTNLLPARPNVPVSINTTITAA